MGTAFIDILKELIIMAFVLFTGNAIARATGRRVDIKSVIQIVTVVGLYDFQKGNKRNRILDAVLVMTAQLMLG